MGYYYTAEPENAVPPKFWATPKTHVPGSPVKERGHRFYNSVFGRWTARDPLGERGGRNLYGFVAKSPINKYDVLGLWSPFWCKDECAGAGARSNFKAKKFVMGPISPTDQALLDGVIDIGEILGTMPSGLSPSEMAEWLIEQGIPKGDVLKTYVQLLLSGLPWNLYVVYEIDVCKESKCCVFWEDRRNLKHTGVYKCMKGGNMKDDLWLPKSKVDNIPAKVLHECVEEAEIDALGGGKVVPQ